MDEVEVDSELTARRRAQQGFIEASFPTIAGQHSSFYTFFCLLQFVMSSTIVWVLKINH